MENVLLEKQGHVSIITINRPKALNALATEVLKDLEAVVKTVDADKDTYVAVILVLVKNPLLPELTLLK